VFCDFANDDLYVGAGRHVFALVNAFALSGCQVDVLANGKVKNIGKWGQHIFTREGVRLVDEYPPDSRNVIYVYDNKAARPGLKRWRKRVEIKLDLFSPYRLARAVNRAPVVMPFGMHPVHWGHGVASTVEELRGERKTLGMFFSGDAVGYHKRFLAYPRSKMSRGEALDTITSRLNGAELAVVRDERTLAKALESQGADKCVIVDTQKLRVEEKQWLPTLARANFFLCLPGMAMPVCHNAIEAMAVGTIPVTNYPEWFKPELKPGENCLVFEDEEDLVEKVREALNMEEKQKESMRREVIRYYEEYLHPVSFANSIVQTGARKVEVLIMTERYVRRNAGSLSRHSIIVA